MRKVYLYLQLTIIFLMTISCKEREGIAKSPAELLTQQEWILAAHGYDENGNGLLDPFEESIGVCEKDNSYVFRENGMATLFDNDVPCNGVPEQTVPWKLVNNNLALDLHFYVASILRLNERELVICEDLAGCNGRPLRFMTVLRHQ
jgi:hypothetical protein